LRGAAQALAQGCIRLLHWIPASSFAAALGMAVLLLLLLLLVALLYLC
jgi:hypothetical protein